MIREFIVVGSGMTGGHAAQTLIEAGRDVLMLDGGIQRDAGATSAPETDFISARELDPEQHRYFLGDAFEGIPWGDTEHTLTPPRQHIVSGTERWLPWIDSAFQRMESLCYGGLGAGWGAGAAVYTRAELEAMGLPPTELAPAYREIAKRIGLAAESDDATPFAGAGLSGTQTPLRMDLSISQLHAAYLRKRDAVRSRGVVMGKVPMAVLTADLGTRRATAYGDMEFWADPGQSVYRSWMTTEALRGQPRFEYRGGLLVTHFREHADHVEVEARRLEDGSIETHRARRLVLGTGTLGTARLVLRSLAREAELPLLSNGYCIAPCLHLRMLGRALERHRTSLGQLEMYFDPGRAGLDVRMVSLFTYRSLLLFKLVREVPLALSDGLALMHALSSALVLATINHPDHADAGKRLRLKSAPDSPTGDALSADYAPTAFERRDNDRAEQRVLGVLASLGCPALKRQHMKPGATLHYAGTLPVSDSERPLTLDSDGRLAGTRRVHVADGSGFRYLPANGLTLTLMANAHRIAGRLSRRRDDD
jgi:choline dehydrogenase-like flavoprotein